MKIDVDNKYSRFELISWWDQSILKNAKILVVGCGALGNEIVKNLAMLGVGNIFVVDMDKVEKSNLTRSVLFREEDEGKYKAEIIAKRAKEINKDVNVKYYAVNIFNLGLGVFKEMDLVICGLDNREARLFVNQSCRKANKVWIDGAIEVLTGVARVFYPENSPCYECTMSEIDYQLLNKRKSCLLLGIEDIEQGKIPTTPTISSIIAAIEVQEAVKVLHGFDQSSILIGKGFIYNGISNDSYIVEYQEKEDCASHYNFKNFHKFDAKFSEAKIKDIFDFGCKHFNTEKFELMFNNEVVYELFDTQSDLKKKIFANMNTMKIDDIKVDDKILKMKLFHSVYNKSELYDYIKDKTLKELNIPVNDILTLATGKEDLHIEFLPEEIFI
ncbi:MAG TPA: ThiF family adenylyltransferase [Ignavibacteria bacterium]|nr:ThiF family adenylyltransferase [Ignavibacteria bacterium]